MSEGVEACQAILLAVIPVLYQLCGKSWHSLPAACAAQRPRALAKACDHGSPTICICHDVPHKLAGHDSPRLACPGRASQE